MGNHNVGRAFHGAFKAIENKIDLMTKEELLNFLDAVGNEWRNTDAEFDDYYHETMPLGKALIKIFNPNWKPAQHGASDEEINKADDDWWNTIWMPFKNRFEFW